MRRLVRNKRRFYYALYQGKTEVLDDEGNLTGEYVVTYSNPILAFGNISSAVGETQIREFGESESYDKVVVLDNIRTPIDEYSILWVDTLPLLNSDGTTNTPHDYMVKRVASSLNEKAIAVSKVIVSE